MMNVIALAFLLSYFGAVVVLVPEPHLTRADHQVFAGSTPFSSAKQTAQNAVCDTPPCPSTMDQIKETVHRGYEKPVEELDSGKESAKETVKGVFQQAKNGVQDEAEQGKQGVQDKAGQLKQGAYETAQQAKQGVQDKAGQVKQGMQEMAEKVGSFIPSTEDVKRGARETGERFASYIPSKEEVASCIPGVETGREAVDVLKQKVGEAKDRVASYAEDSSQESLLDSLRRKLEEAKQQAASYMQGKENDAAYSSFDNMKKKLEEASAYIPKKETAASYIPGIDSIEGVKGGVQETTQRMQDKARDAVQDTVRGLQDKAQDMGNRAREAASSYTQAGEGAASGGYTGKLGGVFHGMKERLARGAREDDESGQLERRVHQLCSWFDDRSEVQGPKEAVGYMVVLDVLATRESYAYLMKSALEAIERAHEVFEKAVLENQGGEWREKYAYLAESAKAALESAKEVFERAATAAEGNIGAHVASQKVPVVGKARNMSRLKEVAAHTKKRLSATLRPLMRAIYLATFSAIYGLTLWMTFLSGHLLARTLPRQQLGIVQSKLFPVYFRMITGCMALCAIIHGVLHPWPSADTWERWQYGNFALCVGLSLLNMLVVEPRTTKMMYEKLKFEKEEGRGQSGEEVNDEVAKARTASIDAKFKGLHQMASCVNLAIVAGLTWHLWYLANRLVV